MRISLFSSAHAGLRAVGCLFWIRAIGVFLGRRGLIFFRGRVSPRRASYFLLLRQKKVAKEKATPLSATLRFAAGNLRCSRFAGSRPNSLRSNKGEPLSAESCAPQRHRGGARPAPHTGLERRWNHPERAHGVGAHAPGGPLRHRRAAERQADQGSQLFDRSEFCETPLGVSSAGKPEGPVTSARRRQGPQRRSPNESAKK